MVCCRSILTEGNRKKTMDTVNFLTIDTGDDLTLSFSFEDDTKYGTPTNV
jgi:hypothetical protein